MTNEQFIEDLEKRRAAADAVFRSFDADSHAPAQLNPALADALEEQKNAPVSPEPSVTPSGTEGTVNVKLGGALKGVTMPFTPGVVTQKPEEKAEEKAEEAGGTSIYDLLLRNEEVRKRASENWERNERSNRARTTIAAVSDALSSLGNLVGTVYGAPNQEQTYQTPLVSAQREQDRTFARALAQKFRENEDTYLLTKMKLDASESAYDREIAKQNLMTERALALAGLRADLAEKNAGWRSDLETQKQEGRESLADKNNASREGIAANRDATSVRTANIRADATRYSADKRAETSAGGVNGYEKTTETRIERDQLGNEVGRTSTTRRTGSNGTTTTTTTTRPGTTGSSSGGSGTQSGGQQGSKTPPSKRKKDNSKTPPSKRK